MNKFERHHSNGWSEESNTLSINHNNSWNEESITVKAGDRSAMRRAINPRGTDIVGDRSAMRGITVMAESQHHPLLRHLS